MMTQFEILDVARSQVLQGGEGLTAAQRLDVLRLPDEALDELLELAHQVRMRWCVCGVPKLGHGR
jgi:biotin synthase